MPQWPTWRLDTAESVTPAAAGASCSAPRREPARQHGRRGQGRTTSSAHRPCEPRATRSTEGPLPPAQIRGKRATSRTSVPPAWESPLSMAKRKPRPLFVRGRAGYSSLRAGWPQLAVAGVEHAVLQGRRCGLPFRHPPVPARCALPPAGTGTGVEGVEVAPAPLQMERASLDAQRLQAALRAALVHTHRAGDPPLPDLIAGVSREGVHTVVSAPVDQATGDQRPGRRRPCAVLLREGRAPDLLAGAGVPGFHREFGLAAVPAVAAQVHEPTVHHERVHRGHIGLGLPEGRAVLAAQGSHSVVEAVVEPSPCGEQVAGRPLLAPQFAARTGIPRVQNGIIRRLVTHVDRVVHAPVGDREGGDRRLVLGLPPGSAAPRVQGVQVMVVAGEVDDAVDDEGPRRDLVSRLPELPQFRPGAGLDRVQGAVAVRGVDPSVRVDGRGRDVLVRLERPDR